MSRDEKYRKLYRKVDLSLLQVRMEECFKDLGPEVASKFETFPYSQKTWILKASSYCSRGQSVGKVEKTPAR